MVARRTASPSGPPGTRSGCPGTRAVGHVNLDWRQEHRRLDHDVLVFGLIEDAKGIANVEAMATHSGFDGLLFGPFDLSAAAGLEGDVTRDTGTLVDIGPRLVAFSVQSQTDTVRRDSTPTKKMDDAARYVHARASWVTGVTPHEPPPSRLPRAARPGRPGCRSAQ